MTDQDRIRELNERARNRIRAHRDSADRALAELWGLRRLDTLEAADTGNLEARVAAYEIRLRLRLEEHVRHSEQAIRDIWYSVCPAKAGYSESEMAPLLSSQAACGGREHINLVGEPSLQAIDASFQQAFGLDRYFSANLSAYPTLYCETLEEFVGSWMALLDISESARQAGIVREAARLAADAERGIGLWGVNFPGRGCYLNGWMFAYGRASSAAAALRDPAIFPHIVGTVAHEKLGHGFVALYTESGREQQQLEMWRFDAAQRFGQRVTDTPEAALLEQKHAVLAMGSRYLEEGWATWIEHHIMSHLASTASAEPTKNPRVPRYSLEQLWNMLTKLKSDLPDQESVAVVDGVLQAIRVLFLEQPPAGQDVHQAALTLQAAEAWLEEPVSRALGQPLRYVLGFLVMQRIEAQLGTLCAPYAVAIAANVTFGIQRIALSDLQHVVQTDPRYNLDTRLFLLAQLQLQEPNSVGELAERAREQLSMAAPDSFRQ